MKKIPALIICLAFAGLLKAQFSKADVSIISMTLAPYVQSNPNGQKP